MRSQLVWSSVQRRQTHKRAMFQGPQNLLRELFVPHRYRSSQSRFLRSLSGIDVPNAEYFQFGAFDQIEAAPVDWKVLEAQMGTPFDLTHVLQNQDS